MNNTQIIDTPPDLEAILSTFESISLDDLLRVELQNRSDTKYCIHAKLLPTLLKDIAANYSLLEINGARLMPYETLYFDTPNFTCYFDHHNGKSTRYKTRVRRYASTNTIFMEAKVKNAKGQTIKNRVTLPYLCENLSEQDQLFAQLHLPYTTNQLLPILWVYYNRLTFSHKTLEERVTIDLNLSFCKYNTNQNYNWNELVIIEVKQPHASRQSPVVNFLKSHRISPSGVSKYCMGMHFVHPNLKFNTFKPKLIHINKNVATHHGF